MNISLCQALLNKKANLNRLLTIYSYQPIKTSTFIESAAFFILTRTTLQKYKTVSSSCFYKAFYLYLRLDFIYAI